jgi:hypothetical protein
MQHEVGYKKPPAHTRFQKGRSGNPGGRPGPRRDMERRFGRALETALMHSPEEMAESRPSSAFDRMAAELVCKAAKPNIAAIKIVLSFLPARGEPVRRMRLPANMLDELMGAYFEEEPVRSAYAEASADRQAQVLRQAQDEAVGRAQDEDLREAQAQGNSAFREAHRALREVQDLLRDTHREAVRNILRRAQAPRQARGEGTPGAPSQGVSAEAASRFTADRRRPARSQGLSRQLREQHRAKCRAIREKQPVQMALPP